MLNWPRFGWAWRRILAGGPVSLTARSSDAWTIHPEEEFEVPPAVCLEGAVERITSLSPWRNWDAERLLIHGGPTKRSATRAWVLEDVSIVRPVVYGGAARSQVGYVPDSWLLPLREDYVDLDRAALVSTWSGSRWFGCYLLDDFPLELLSPSEAKIALEGNAYRHQLGYRQRLGLVPQPTRIRHGRIKQMVYYEDPGVNTHKADRFRALRAQLRERMAGETVAGAGRLIYLKRGRTGDPRMLLNEAEIECMLTRFGFEIVEPAGLSVDEIVRRTTDARCVVSVEGSHKSHCIYTLADSGVLVVLQPPDRFALPYKDFMDALGMRCGFLVGVQGEGGFRILPEELERMLHLVL